MPYNPNEKLDIKVEIQINGVWVTVTSRSRSAGGVRIKRAYSDGAIQPETSRCQIVIGNDDGWLTEGNPLSPWYPYIGRGTPIKLSLAGILPSDAKRFEGEIEEMLAIYPGGDSSSMLVFATGSLGVAAQTDDEFDSPMYRTSTHNGAIEPVFYWSMEDQTAFAATSLTAAEYGADVGTETSDSVAWAWALSGTGPPFKTLQGSEKPTTDSTLRGSRPVVHFVQTTQGMALVVPAYTEKGKWVLGGAFRLGTAPTGRTGVFRVRLAPTIVGPWVFASLNPITSEIEVGYSALALGPITYFATSTLDTEAALADWVYVTLISDNASSGATDRLTFNARNSAGDLLGSVTVLTDATTHGTVYGIDTKYLGGSAEGMGAGHIVFYTDPAFTVGTHDVSLARSMHGWEGEQAHERLQRLAAEEGLQISITGSLSAQMGPQRVATLFDLFTDCERADQGLLADDGPATYRCLDDLYNQDAQVAVQFESLMPDFAPAWDNQHVSNDWTLSRLTGTSARVSDDDHVTATRRRLKASLSVNTYLDSTLPDHAGWRVAKGTAPGPRYSNGGINLRNRYGAQLADAVLGLIPGDRLTVASTALPVQHPPYGADQMVIGWTEYLDAYQWEFYPVMVPYSPYVVGIAGDDVDGGAWPQTGEGTVLASDLAIGATSVSLTVDGAPFSTTADFTLSPLTLIVGGERLPVVSISGAGPAQTVVVIRTLAKAHLTGASVQVFQPLYAAL